MCLELLGEAGLGCKAGFTEAGAIFWLGTVRGFFNSTTSVIKEMQFL